MLDDGREHFEARFKKNIQPAKDLQAELQTAIAVGHSLSIVHRTEADYVADLTSYSESDISESDYGNEDE